jgi:hypothetical protein
VTDAAGRHRLAGWGRAQRATGSPINDAEFCSADIGHAWLRSRRAVAPNDQQKSGPLNLSRCDSSRARPAGRRIGGCRHDGAAAGGFLFRVIVDRRFGATMELGR